MALIFYKWFLISFLQLWSQQQNGFDSNHLFSEILHPFHVSVTEINHNAKDKTLEISCKIFTDDFEDALNKKYKAKIDLVHPTDKPAMDKLVRDYIGNHLSIKADDKNTVMNYIGFEVEAEAVYVYLQVNDIAALKKTEVTCTILHDMYTDQTEIVHVIVNGNRKSVKIDYPLSQAMFQF
jgi:hypothetical protein